LKKFFSAIFSLLIIAGIYFAVYVNQKFTTEQINKVKGMYYVNLGDAAYNELKMHKAIKLYNIGVKLFPGHYGAWENLGNIYVAYEDYPAALYAYTQAFIHNPALMTARMKYGVIATQKMGNFDDALVQFNEVVNTKRKLVTIPYIYDNAESTKQNKAIAYYNIGVTYRLKSIYSTDDWETQRKYMSEAIQAYTKSLEIAPNKYDTLYNLGLAYHIAQRYNDAGLLYCKAIQVKPMNYEAHYNLGVLLRRMRKYQDSYNELEKAATLITALDEDDVQIQYVALILNDIMHQMYSNESYQKQLQREKIEEEMIRQARAKKWHFNFRFGKKENYDNYDQEYWYEEDSENNKKKIKSTLGEGIKIIDGKITATEDLDKAVTEEFSKCPSIKYFKGVYD
jgi:tetratricopeptide (TPR) repeat protein